jgi:hypothetical protein
MFSMSLSILKLKSVDVSAIYFSPHLTF